MSVLFDTNIFIRAAQPGHALQPLAVKAGDILKARGDEVCVVPQVLYEFWSVATRPAGENGLGLTTVEARIEVSRIKRLFLVHADTPAILPLWEELVAAHDVKSKNTHDARLVAAMKVHGVSDVLTFNPADFARYSNIAVLAPQEVVEATESPRA
ncbi:MAG: type II toxin-antitoxin system VapC family toxin [Phycisphaerales bacterium]|nr:type II toxin-antitoxin system VapC family toxin [Phycisphaerales bacterium]